jgi:hypothetical protein
MPGGPLAQRGRRPPQLGADRGLGAGQQPRRDGRAVATRVRLKATVCPAGQVTMPACSSTVKSSMVSPPCTGACSGLGLITAWCPAFSIASRRSPVP